MSRGARKGLSRSSKHWAELDWMRGKVAMRCTYQDKDGAGIQLALPLSSPPPRPQAPASSTSPVWRPPVTTPRPATTTSPGSRCVRLQCACSAPGGRGAVGQGAAAGDTAPAGVCRRTVQAGAGNGPGALCAWHPPPKSPTASKPSPFAAWPPDTPAPDLPARSLCPAGSRGPPQPRGVQLLAAGGGGQRRQLHQPPLNHQRTGERG